MKSSVILSIQPLDFLWPVKDPFLFCAYHLDSFPQGNASMEPPAGSLEGRDIGQDFTIKDGWRMYHGETVPGFPEHPHRGFETVTVVMQGMVDHSDSWGQSGRYGNGDVQWMTAGSGLQHCEMFPLINQNKDNPAELFQVWLNLPKAKKFADPHFKMLWSEDIPLVKIIDKTGKSATIKIIAGKFNDTPALPPAPDSWAAQDKNEVGIWTIKMEPGVQFTIPPANKDANRFLYFYRGATMNIEGREIPVNQAIELVAGQEVSITNGDASGYIFVLQAMPINEPVAKYGPFVMNTNEEIQQAIDDYRKTSFGGWPWPRRDVVHPPEQGRFAKHRDGRVENK